jgi:hypothetical protein
MLQQGGKFKSAENDLQKYSENHILDIIKMSKLKFLV